MCFLPAEHTRSTVSTVLLRGPVSFGETVIPQRRRSASVACLSSKASGGPRRSGIASRSARRSSAQCRRHARIASSPVMSGSHDFSPCRFGTTTVILPVRGGSDVRTAGSGGGATARACVVKRRRGRDFGRARPGRPHVRAWKSGRRRSGGRVRPPTARACVEKRRCRVAARMPPVGDGTGRTRRRAAVCGGCPHRRRPGVNAVGNARPVRCLRRRLPRPNGGSGRWLAGRSRGRRRPASRPPAA